MSIFGARIAIERENGRSVSESELEQIFSSLESNMAIVSIDIAADLDSNRIEFLLGVECPEGFNPTSFVPGVVDDALSKALGDGGVLEDFRQDSARLTPIFA